MFKVTYNFGLFCYVLAKENFLPKMQIMFLLPMKWHVTKNTNGANWEICQIKNNDSTNQAYIVMPFLTT